MLTLTDCNKAVQAALVVRDPQAVATELLQRELG